VQCLLWHQRWLAWRSCIVWKCRIGREGFERYDLRNVGGVRGWERWSRWRDAAADDDCLVVMAMIVGGIVDDCEAMVDGAAGLLNA